MRPLPRLALLLLPFAAAGALTLAGCSSAEGSGPPAQPMAPAVTVAPVVARELVEYDEFTGRTAAIESVEVRPRVSGHLQEVHFRSGELVEAGAVLFTIDPRWHQAEFERTQAELERAEARLATAEREERRAQQLLEARAISLEESEQRGSAFSEARAAVAAARAAHASAALDLEHTRIRAPIRGRTSRALVTAGNYVSGNSGSNTLLTTLVSVDPVYVLNDVDEGTWLRLQRLVQDGSLDQDAEGRVAVEMELQDEQGFPRRGHIESFDNHLDPATGSILLRTVFPNPDGRLLPGLFTRVRVPGSVRKQAVLISERAIGTDQSQKFVLVLGAANTVEYRAIELGPIVDGLRLVRRGLEPGERIVVNGLQRVRPGMSVTPQEEGAAAAPSAR